jgi:integrase
MTSPAKVKQVTFPKTVTVEGIAKLSATIYRNRQTKNGTKYINYTLAYPLLGKLKRQTFADLDLATAAGEEAIKRMANDEQRVLELTSNDRDVYLRAQDYVKPLGIALDVAARDHVEVLTILNGIGTPAEAARLLVQQRTKKLPRITVADAVTKCLTQCRADGKSKVRMHELDHYLGKFSGDMQCDVSDLTPGGISHYLTGLTASERTKKNCRDILAYFSRWLVLHGYLDRGTNLLEGVQKYSKRNGNIQIFTPAEISKLIEQASDDLLPYIVIGAFAGLRGAEIQRLDWAEVDLQDNFIEVKAENSKTDIRRLVPIKPNLVAWLRTVYKKSGPVCSLKSLPNYLIRLVETVNKKRPKSEDPMKWRKNALRHSFISYRVAECADVPRVADESGNSVSIIKTNYLKRVKPPQAAEWFGIMPSGSGEAEGKVALFTGVK